ncbi:MAG TPA: cytochrome c peroxidase, partial [Gammaproteobacteria bacterium]|nr:cytochrome c peroxidase [Gammaproteobacteria bacterium]
EAQTLSALANSAEMSRSDHDWNELTDKLTVARPLALASELPDDIAQALQSGAGYPELFAAAFGDPAITPVRIAFAIAVYQRTLVADRTPWDRMRAGAETALSDAALRGWRDFQAFRCTSCHAPPLFTNDDFANIGLRLSRFDAGRMNVTGDPEDAGEMKVPSLRNVALRPRFMHTGQFRNLGAAIGFYQTGAALEDRDTLPNGSVYSFNMGAQSERDIRTFLEEGLTDPRVREERYPFDRPRLASETRTQ